MSTKKIIIGKRPTKNVEAEKANAWVENRDKTSGVMKRLTIDVSEELHRAIKTQCAMRGVNIADEVRELLISKYGNK
jgi:ParG.